MKLRNTINDGKQSNKLRQRALFIGGAIVLFLAILFGSQVDNLLNLFGSRADEITDIPVWALHKDGNSDVLMSRERSLGALVDVRIDSGRYLYAIGGMDDDSMLDTVERLPLNPTLGTPEEDAQWETSAGGWGKMYSPRAAFKAFQYNDYLYVVSGDIHIPYDDEKYENPLLFSTIERLELGNNTADWEPVSVLAGVNFYPEILVDGNSLHIVGGVYGYPKEFCGQVDLSGDQTKWNDRYGSLPVMGPDIGSGGSPQEMLGLPDGGIGDEIGQGGSGTGDPNPTPIPGGGAMGGTTTYDDGMVHIAQVADEENFAKMLSDVSISGDFVTSVSEYYIIDLTNNSETHAGELGISNDVHNDYRGNLYENWKVGAIAKIGHLRAAIQQKKTGPISSPTIEYLINSPPQGRYGHKIFLYDEDGEGGDLEYLYVVGGASWSGIFEKVEVINVVVGRFRVYINNLNTFWVIADIPHVITWEMDDDPLEHGNLPQPNGLADGLFEGLEYQYIGNTSYRINTSNQTIIGTNTQTNSPYLDSKYKLGAGRAFFGLTDIHPDENTTEWVLTGGLRNNYDDNLDEEWKIGYEEGGVTSYDYVLIPGLRYDHQSGTNGENCSDYTPLEDPVCGNWGLSIGVSDQVDKLADSNGWIEQIALPYSVYNHGSIGLSAQTYIFGGALAFGNPDTPFFNYHMPTTASTPSPSAYLQTIGENWVQGGDVERNSLHPAILAVRTPISIIGGIPQGQRIVGYKAGGVNEGRIEYIGPVEYGGVGAFDITKSDITISPFLKPVPNDPSNNSVWDQVDIDGINTRVPTVMADRWDYATVTITLNDYYGNPANAEGLYVTMYTDEDRSPAPAVNNNIWWSGDSSKEWIRMAGDSGPDPIYGDDQFAVVDYADENGQHTTDHDSNSATGPGQVQFRVSSAFNTYSNETTSDPINIYIMVINDSGTILADNPVGEGLNRISFTSHGVPSYKSYVTATSPVSPDGTDHSDGTATLLDVYEDPVPDKPIIVESNRNVDHSNPPDGSIDIWDVINIPNNITDSQGEVDFTVTSEHIGYAQMIGYVDNAFPYTNSVGESRIVDDLEQEERHKKLGVRTTYILFDNQGQIISLIPDFGRQGQGNEPPALLPVAIGKNTLWQQGATEVDFIRPKLGYFWGPKGEENYDIDQFIIPNDPYPRELGVVVMPYELVTLTIEQGSGSFYPYSISEYPKTVLSDMPADENGHVYFQYLPGIDENDILKIKAEAHTSGKTGKLWLPVLKNLTALEMRVTAVPDSLSGTNVESIITAEAYINGFLVDVDINFEKDEDSGGTLDIGYGDANQALYTRTSVESGVLRVFASATIGSSLEKMIGRAAITKVPTSGGDPNALITYSSSDLVVGSNTILNIVNSGIVIPFEAELGLWLFQTETIIGALSKTETHPFIVLERDLITGPRILTIDPDKGLLGTDEIYEITAADTYFVETGSQVIFTPVNPDPTNPNEELIAEVRVGDPFNDLTHLRVNLDIPKDITPGYWDVRVETGDNEVAEKQGSRDFFITTNTNWLLKLDAVPETISRNGTDDSNITAKLIFIDPSDGLLKPEPGVSINFNLETNNGGDIDVTNTTTGSAGKAFTEYTTDAGDIDATATIKATATISGVTQEVSNTVDIERLAWTGTDDPDSTETTISAISPVTVDTNGDGIPYSTIIVTVRNSLGYPLDEKEVTLLSDRGGQDSIAPSHTQTTNQDGKVFYQVSSAQEGLATLTASIETVDIEASVRFEPEGVLEERSFNVYTPFQNRDYDNWTRISIKDNSWSQNGDTDFSETYRKNARDAVSEPDLVAGLTEIPFYLYDSHT
ncbi:MAG: hypothetical protein U9M89_02280, partial [Patescibacteria group bacterium]|nr:hypothetical protein [Patescibacteria group bacterium]